MPCPLPSRAGRSQPSLNLSHAVAVVASQLFDLQQQRLLALEQQQQQQQQQQGGNAAACRGSSVDGAAGSSEDGAQQQAAVLALLAGGAGVSGSLFEGGECMVCSVEGGRLPGGQPARHAHRAAF